MVCSRPPILFDGDERLETPRPITFVVAVKHRTSVLENNFLASPCFTEQHPHQILVQVNYASAARAYNDAVTRSTNDLIVFAHQDVFFLNSWTSQLERALEILNETDPNWGVLGCFGKTINGEDRGYIYSNGMGILGEPFRNPIPVQTLDEIVLILRKSSGLQFDERLPHFHLYGADICLAASKKGLRSYAISAPCVHNTHRNLVLAKEFYECYRHLKRTWRDFLPIHTTCILVSKSDIPMYVRRLREIHLRYVRRYEVSASRVENVQKLIEKFESSPHKVTELIHENGR